jgi:hypothetical protein
VRLRILEQLEEQLSSNLKRRKLELSAMRGLIRRNQDASNSPLIRAATMLLYAHWEGFVRDAASFYINFVSNQGLQQQSLATNFLALCLRSELLACGRPSATQHNLCVATLRSELTQPAAISEAVVDTRDNLRGEVFRDIAELLGIEFTRYAPKEKFIDYTLCDRRNAVAHGRLDVFGPGMYDEMHDEVVWLIDSFRDDILNAATTKRYLRDQPIAKSAH